MEGGVWLSLKLECADLLLIFHSFNSGSSLAIFLKHLGGEVIFFYAAFGAYSEGVRPSAFEMRPQKVPVRSTARREDKNNNNGGSNIEPLMSALSSLQR